MITPLEAARAVESGNADTVFGLLDRETAVLDVVVFSCSVFDLQSGQSRRIYTNRPDIYPVSGLKPIVRNRWTETVLDRHETFLSKNADDLVDVFPDHELIRSIGCGAIINMPVVCSGVFMGTVNLLRQPVEYSKKEVEFAKECLWLAQTAFLMSAFENEQSTSNKGNN